MADLQDFDRLASRGNGPGPYKVVDHVPGKSITLERNADYFKDSPKAQPKKDRKKAKKAEQPDQGGESTKA